MRTRLGLRGSPRARCQATFVWTPVCRHSRFRCIFAVGKKTTKRRISVRKRHIITMRGNLGTSHQRKKRSLPFRARSTWSRMREEHHGLSVQPRLYRRRSRACHHRCICAAGKKTTKTRISVRKGLLFTAAKDTYRCVATLAQSPAVIVCVSRLTRLSRLPLDMVSSPMIFNGSLPSPPPGPPPASCC